MRPSGRSNEKVLTVRPTDLADRTTDRSCQDLSVVRSALFHLTNGSAVIAAGRRDGRHPAHGDTHPAKTGFLALGRGWKTLRSAQITPLNFYTVKVLLHEQLDLQLLLTSFVCVWS